MVADAVCRQLEDVRNIRVRMAVDHGRENLFLAVGERRNRRMFPDLPADFGRDDTLPVPFEPYPQEMGATFPCGHDGFVDEIEGCLILRYVKLGKPLG